ncbi:hypothetical protein [Paraburkholderia sediminicola]|uniref:hypothetical protein n=1 Tax=Paraburkholderia sediminicola TaxID=458836 RepID=UPI000EB5225B
MSGTDDRSDLEALFSPPQGEHGTHLLLCGLSNDAETLERMLAVFTNETPAQRRARGLVRGLLLLDASNRQSRAQPVPGLLQLSPCLKAAWRSRTSLMHAKVALMGFGPSAVGVPRGWRLVVCTGNWTAETWGRQGQIDLFWTTEWREQGNETNTDQALADVHAAFGFFERLLRGLYGKHYGDLAGDAVVTGWLSAWRERLQVRGAASKRKPQFIHSLDRSLFEQIRSRFPRSGVSTLVAGSGFFEQAGRTSPDSAPRVLRKLESLGDPRRRLLVFNPQRAGAIAAWLEQLRATTVGARKLARSLAGQWELCLPRDPLEKNEKAGRKFLHAKYIAGLDHISKNNGNSARLVFLYLGSGNLSNRGFLTRACVEGDADERGNVGNVEAGVVLLPDERIGAIWQRLACGDWASPQDLKAAEAGAGEELFEPLDPPPVLFLRQGDGCLHLVRSEVPPAPLWLQGPDGSWIEVAPVQASVTWTAPCPPFVRVCNVEPVAQVQPLAPGWDVAVLSANGLFCRRIAPQLGVESVLQALLAFPALPPHEHEDDEEDEGTKRKARGGASARGATVRYALRTLAMLVETIAQRNVQITPEEFPYWLAQLRALLLEQTAPGDREAIRKLDVDLFDALDQPGFVPPWLAQRPDLREQYQAFLRDLRAAWCAPSNAEAL